MKKTTVYLPDDVKADLTRTAVSRGVSEAEIIREAVRRAVRSERPRPRGALFSSGNLVARRVDEMLKGFGER